MDLSETDELRWGIARDDRRAFAELRQACDDSLIEGGLDFHQSPGAVKLSSQQKKAFTVRTPLCFRLEED